MAGAVQANKVPVTKKTNTVSALKATTGEIFIQNSNIKI